MEDLCAMNHVETISRIDSIIRVLSHLDSTQEIDSEKTRELKESIHKEDWAKLASLFEDIVVLLKDDPDNKAKIRQMWNRIMNGYGHVKPISEILELVKKYFL
jgi:DNA-directed RNA polymerase subunit F